VGCLIRRFYLNNQLICRQWLPVRTQKTANFKNTGNTVDFPEHRCAIKIRLSIFINDSRTSLSVCHRERKKLITHFERNASECEENAELYVPHHIVFYLGDKG